MEETEDQQRPCRETFLTHLCPLWYECDMKKAWELTDYPISTSGATDIIASHKFIQLLLKLIHKTHNQCLPETARFLGLFSMKKHTFAVSYYSVIFFF